MSQAPFYGCCDDGHRIDFTKAKFPNPFWYVYWDWDFTITALWIIAYPLYWIFVSQLEYRTGILRRFFRGAYIACGLFAMTLLPISLYRDCRFITTVRRQAPWWILRQNPVLWTGHGFVVLGLVLVITSFRLLGLWAMLLGDYFKIHEYSIDVRRRFPYSWFHHPMYCGASFIFFGFSLVMASQAGLVLALLAFLMYQVAVYFEHAQFCHFHHVSSTVTTQQQTVDLADGDKVHSAGADDSGQGEADVQSLGAAYGKMNEDERAARARAPREDKTPSPKVKCHTSETEETAETAEGKKDR